MENVFNDFFVFSFVAHARSEKESYRNRRRNLWLTLQKHSWFEKGETFNSVEKGVIYPVIHRLHLNTNKVALLEPSELGEDFDLRQGIYTEIHRFQPPNFASASRAVDDKACVFVGFVCLENALDSVLEESWKEWTGARLMYSNLSPDFSVSRLSFYRRLDPPDPDVFMYVLLVECADVTSRNIFRLLNFVQKLRVERVFGYLSVYKTESTLLTSSLINGMLMESEDTNGKVDI
ncbi:uncharacterized protein [Centruroides vittatus]|uniref:uncharacterized protein n=1 Tax=Centruroides vittatus TaxID=120091 RepID=UPI00350F0760